MLIPYGAHQAFLFYLSLLLPLTLESAVNGCVLVVACNLSLVISSMPKCLTYYQYREAHIMNYHTQYIAQDHQCHLRGPKGSNFNACIDPG